VAGTRADAPSAASGNTSDRAPASQVSDRVLTVPNALSALRLAGVPVFLWLVLGPEADGWAVLLLMASGWTDYFDGKIARKYGLVSRVGQLLDPLADRLYILTTVLAFTVRGVLPLYLTLILFSRDLLLSALLPVFRKHGFGPPPVNFMGKAATYNLLYAFPLLLLGAGHNTLATYARPVGWAFLLWGVTLYWWAGLLYVRQLRAVVRPRAVPGTVTP
jgi:cardiolipin synthase